jgi:two-component system cell cycle sensor histidine kinase/response regulator CckA
MATASTVGALRAPHEISVWARIRHVERRQWWLWVSAIAVTLLLTVGMASFSYIFAESEPQISGAFRDSLRGLIALIVLFDLYTIYQQLQIHHIRRQLTEQEEMFRLITENADDLITVIDLEGKRLYSSPGYRNIFGYSREELLGTAIDEQIHPDDREAIRIVCLETFEKGTAPRQEYRFQQKDGEWRTLESNASPVRNHLGEIEKIVLVSRDITDRKLAEQMLRQRDEQLRQAQKMEAVGRLSGGIAHDFNNLLGVIIGYSETIEHQLPQDDPLRKNAEQIRKAGERAAALTHQLLAFSRRQVLQPKVLDLNSVVTDMGKMLRRLIGVNIELTTRLDSDLCRVKADQSQIEQVLVNLAVNARDAMPDGGSLVIETANTDVTETLARGLPFLRPGPHVLLTVSDTGIGMDLSTQRHIFEPFFTTKPPGKGTGLGLATVYGVVKQSGGVVGVDSKPGKGSRFKIYLPQSESSVADSTSGPVSYAPAKGTDTILLVEDEEALLNLTAAVLRENGYMVLTARDGIQALEVARTFVQPIHLLLTDIAMPRMGGPALARHMADLRPAMRVLFMTGNAGRDPAVDPDLPATSETLSKPYSHQALIGHVRRALDAAVEVSI